MHNYLKPLRVMISEARLKANMTQKELAEISGLTPALISKYESGKSKPRAETLERLAKVLKINLSELLEANEDYSNLFLIDYIVDDSGSFLDSKPYGLNSSVLKSIKCNPQDLGAFLINGDSMSPILNPSDTILFNKKDTIVRDGDIYLMAHQGNLMARRLYKLLNGDLRIISDHPLYPENILTKNELIDLDFVIYGKVVWRGGAI